MITEEELKKLQKLAKLSFSKDELDGFTKKLNSVMAMIDSLAEANCENIEPLRSVSDMYQRTREDEVTVGDIADQLFANVPAQNAAFAKEAESPLSEVMLAKVAAALDILAAAVLATVSAAIFLSRSACAASAAAAAASAAASRTLIEFSSAVRSAAAVSTF